MSSTTWKVQTSNHEYVSTIINTPSDMKWSGDFCFVQAADPQFGLNDFYNNPNYQAETADLTFELELSNRAVEKVNKMNPKPKFFIVCGDLINESYKSEEYYSVELKSKQTQVFKDVFSKVDKDIPLVCVCGNHDVGNTPTSESIQLYNRHFGDDYFCFWCGGVFFIVLNSQLYKDDRNVQNLAKEQDEWLLEQLNRAAGKRIVCFSHIPAFVEDSNEEESIFNLPPTKRIKLLDTLYDAGVRHFFNGHYHRNGAVQYKDMKIVITSAIGLQFGDDRSGFRIVDVSENDISHRYVDLVDD